MSENSQKLPRFRVRLRRKDDTKEFTDRAYAADHAAARAEIGDKWGAFFEVIDVLVEATEGCPLDLVGSSC
jgi:hypothetical protein